MKKCFSNLSVPVFSLIIFTIFVFGSCKKSSAPAPIELPVILYVTASPLTQSLYYGETATLNITVSEGANLSATANGMNITIANNAIVLPNLKKNTEIVVTAKKSTKTDSVKATILVFSQKISWVSRMKSYNTKREVVFPNGSVTDITHFQSCTPPLKFETNGVLRRFNAVCTPGMIEGVSTWSFLENESKIEFGGAVPWTIVEMDATHMLLLQPDSQGNFNRNTYVFAP